MRITVRTKLIVAILTPLLAAYLGVLAINYHSGTRQAAAQAEQHLTELAANHAARLDSRLVVAEQAVQSIHTLFQEHETLFPLPRGEVLLARILIRNPQIYGACIAFEPDEASGEAPTGVYLCRPARPKAPSKKPESPPDKAGEPSRPREGDGAKKDVAGAPAAAKAGGDADDRPEPPGPGGSGKASKPRPAAAKRPGLADYLQMKRKGELPPKPAPKPEPPPSPGLPLQRCDLAEMPNCLSEDWYQAAKVLQTVVWSDPFEVPTEPGVTVVRCSLPLVKDEQVKGVAAFDLLLGPVQDYVRKTELEDGYCLLVSHTGRILVHPRRKYEISETLQGLAESRHDADLAELADDMSQGGGVRRLKDFYTGLPSWVAFAPVASTGWSFAAVVPEGRIMDPVYSRLRNDMAFMLGGLGVIVLLVLLVSIHITRPIARLAPVVRQVAAGNLDARLEGVHSRDEIGEFASTFNKMLEDLNGHVRALTRETAAREAVESELRIAREIQASLLPHTFPPFPHRGEFDLHAVNVPAKQVAGDFFDFFFINRDVLALLIADVSGKGVPAALFMAVARTIIRNQAMNGASPGEVLTRANRLLFRENDRDMFVTVFFTHYDTRTGELTYANAGHNPPCLGGRSGEVRCLETIAGPILGVFDDPVYECSRTRMEPGDFLLMYTDGVTEALNESDEQFSLDRVRRIVAGNPEASPEEICDLVVQTVEDYRARVLQDDMTLQVLRRNR